MFKKFITWLNYLFWKKLTDKPRAVEVLHEFTCIKYRDQWINLNKSKGEHLRWNSLSRHDRRGMAARFRVMEKKGLIEFIEIDGKMTCKKTEKAKSHEYQKDFRK